jgi:hypothetical protein
MSAETTVDLTPEQTKIGKVFEPRIWSHITDVLPDDHPLAWTSVYCTACKDMVHASNNECMTTWVETGKGGYCLACFVAAVREDVPARQMEIQGKPWTQPAATYYLLDEGDWSLSFDKDREAAYRAGQEDAARAAEEVFPTSTDTMRAFLARHRLSDTPSVGAVSVALLADVRKAISPERSSQGVGDLERTEGP